MTKFLLCFSVFHVLVACPSSDDKHVTLASAICVSSAEQMERVVSFVDAGSTSALSHDGVNTDDIANCNTGDVSLRPYACSRSDARDDDANCAELADSHIAGAAADGDTNVALMDAADGDVFADGALRDARYSRSELAPTNCGVDANGNECDARSSGSFAPNRNLDTDGVGNDRVTTVCVHTDGDVRCDDSDTCAAGPGISNSHLNNVACAASREDAHDDDPHAGAGIDRVSCRGTSVPSRDGFVGSYGVTGSVYTIRHSANSGGGGDGVNCSELADSHIAGAAADGNTNVALMDAADGDVFADGALRDARYSRSELAPTNCGVDANGDECDARSSGSFAPNRNLDTDGVGNDRVTTVCVHTDGDVRCDDSDTCAAGPGISNSHLNNVACAASREDAYDDDPHAGAGIDRVSCRGTSMPSRDEFVGGHGVTGSVYTIRPSANSDDDANCSEVAGFHIVCAATDDDGDFLADGTLGDAGCPRPGLACANCGLDTNGDKCDASSSGCVAPNRYLDTEGLGNGKVAIVCVDTDGDERCDGGDTCAADLGVRNSDFNNDVCAASREDVYGNPHVRADTDRVSHSNCAARILACGRSDSGIYVRTVHTTYRDGNGLLDGSMNMACGCVPLRSLDSKRTNDLRRLAQRGRLLSF